MDKNSLICIFYFIYWFWESAVITCCYGYVFFQLFQDMDAEMSECQPFCVLLDFS
uniref:Uncharacterized protein n=1 Tax=Anguilla anguilla TaxID=7936 RepID=A0A0E9VCR2_ANGAN